MQLPDENSLKELFNLLHKDNYKVLQFIPFSNHYNIYKKKELPLLVEEEKRLLERISMKEPILYNYSLCKEYYYYFNKIRKKQLILANFLLFSNIVSVSELKKKIPEYFDIVQNFLNYIDENYVRFQFRIVPVFDFMILADTLDCNLSDRVFLFKDSLQFASYLKGLNINPAFVADIGTGSGILALTMANFQRSRVLAVDINQRALDFAKINIIANGLSKLIEIKKGSIENIADRKIDLVISNPPYMFLNEHDTSSCVNGGSFLGMEIPLKFIKIAIDNEKKITMIISTPISSKGNEFEKLLSKDVKICYKKIVGINNLHNNFSSHIPLIKQGIIRQELTIYIFSRNV